MPLTLKLKCSRKLNFTILSYPLSYECGCFVSAGIQILNDSKVRQGHFVIVQKAEILWDRARVLCLGISRVRGYHWRLGS